VTSWIRVFGLVVAFATQIQIGWTQIFDGPRRANNFVHELFRLEQPPSADDLRITFQNPRDGWVYMELKPSETSEFSAYSEDSGNSTVLFSRENRAEAMWFLAAGNYAFRIELAEPSQVDSVIVRAIPELHYCRFPADPVVEEYGAFDWDYLSAQVLPHINTIVGLPTEESDARIAPWVDRGGKWIAYGSLPHDKGLTAGQAFEYWRKNPGFTHPRLSGLIADEFQGRQNEWYPAWTEAMRRLGNDPDLDGKVFYGYCGGPGMYTRPQTRELVRTVFEAGYYMAWERYLHEMPTLMEAEALLDSHLGQEVAKWRSAFPDCQKQMVLVSGLFTSGLSLDVQPEVDYKVWMDMQMQYLAKHPDFDGLFGLHWWNSALTDEETLRWMARLFRHYAIEGNTELLSKSLGYEYIPGLIENPDFAHGTAGWEISAAAPDSVRTDYVEHYGRLQGRYWHRAEFPDEPAGNTFLWMRSQADKPNIVSQTMHGLNPGQLYSVKLMTADYEGISLGASEKKLLPLLATVEGAEIIPDKTFVSHSSSANSSPSELPFDGQRPAWFNLHRIVFRATGKEATLRISDWARPDEPGAPAGQELMINFVEAQPYFGSPETDVGQNP
jgi:hypothetical protein